VGAAWQRPVAVENIGLGGVCLVVEEGLATGDAITLSFTAPSLWDPLVLRARVAWVTAAGGQLRAGVAFEHEDAGALYALYELIAALGYD